MFGKCVWSFAPKNLVNNNKSRATYNFGAENKSNVPNFQSFASKTKKAEEKTEGQPEKRKRFWDGKENQQLFLEQVKKQLKFTSLNDWFTLSSADVSMRGGAGLLQRYNGNLYTALASLYPQHNWNILEIEAIPTAFWEARDNHKYYLDLLGKKLNLNSQSDWEKLTIQDILDHRGADLLKVYNGKLITVLKSVYPEKQWNSTPNLEENYWDNTEHVKEFVYQLKKNCGFETEEDWYTVTREQIEENRGVGLYDKGGLYAALKLTYPEIEWNAKIFRKKDAERISILKGLFSQTIHHAKPIPTTPPFKFKISRNSKTDVQLMLARNWDSSIDPSGYWISEKFDGIRGFWDGTRLFSRHGNVLNAPEWWKERLPKNYRLDGEVWTDYGEFSKLNGMVKFDKEWKNVKLMVFDSPDHHICFEERIEKLKNANIENDVVQLVPFVKCTGYEHLQQELERVNQKGGEGLMIRKDDSLYIEGRSSDMLKVKQLLDCEVRMLKASEKAVAFDCELPNGAEVIARCAYHEYQNPPPRGTILTVAHYGFWKSGKLKHPFVLRKRDDITWEQAVEAFKEQHPDQMCPPIKELEGMEEEEEEEDDS